MVKVFLTGATGYIGGQVLHALAKSHPEYSLIALVRDSSKAKAVTGVSSNIQVVDGDLDDSEVIAREAGNADVVLQLAANKHLKAAKTIRDALAAGRKSSSRPAYYIQVSGATVLAAAELADKSRKPGAPSDLEFDDLERNNDIVSVIEKHPFREVDNYVLSVGRDTPEINTALVFPPIIFGRGDGPVNERSIQVPELAKATIQRGRGLQLGAGHNRWSTVHIRDLGDLFVRLVEEAVRGNNEDLWNVNGLYLTGVGEAAFGEISNRVVKAAIEKGHIKDDDVEKLDPEQFDALFPHGLAIYGTNARGKGLKARKVLGWKPSDEDLETDIPRVVAEEAKNLGKG